MARDLCRVVAVAVALAAPAAAGAQVWPPRLVGSFPAPPEAEDVAYEDRGLYVLVNAASPTVCQLTTKGSLVASFRAPVPAPARGITYDGRDWHWFFVSNRTNGYIYRLTTAGSLAGSFRCPAGAPYGLGFTDIYNPHGRGLFAACRDAGYVARLDVTTGSLLSTFAGPAAAVVTYDDFFAGVRGSTNAYWDYYRRWEVFEAMPARPLGVAAAVDWPIDQWVELYILCQNGYIYRYEGYTAIAPASLGRIRVMYR